jgi:hypothetical protein
MRDPVPPGADWGESVSVSSRKGFVDRGLSGRLLGPGDTGELGETARFRKGLLEPRLMLRLGDCLRSTELPIGVSNLYAEKKKKLGSGRGVAKRRPELIRGNKALNST